VGASGRVLEGHGLPSHRTCPLCTVLGRTGAALPKQSRVTGNLRSLLPRPSERPAPRKSPRPAHHSVGVEPADMLPAGRTSASRLAGNRRRQLHKRTAGQGGRGLRRACFHGPESDRAGSASPSDRPHRSACRPAGVSDRTSGPRPVLDCVHGDGACGERGSALLDPGSPVQCPSPPEPEASSVLGARIHGRAIGGVERTAFRGRGRRPALLQWARLPKNGTRHHGFSSHGGPGDGWSRLRRQDHRGSGARKPCPFVPRWPGAPRPRRLGAMTIPLPSLGRRTGAPA